MTVPHRNPEGDRFDLGMIRTAIDHSRQSARQIDDLRAANARTIRTPETALDHAIKGASSTSSTAPDGAADHRRAHRRGFPARIASDPELEAFIRARMDTMTFARIIAEVNSSFPPERRTCMTAAG